MHFECYTNSSVLSRICNEEYLMYHFTLENLFFLYGCSQRKTCYKGSSNAHSILTFLHLCLFLSLFILALEAVNNPCPRGFWRSHIWISRKSINTSGAQSLFSDPSGTELHQSELRTEEKPGCSLTWLISVWRLHVRSPLEVVIFLNKI